MRKLIAVLLALLLINLGDDICVLMSVYPNAYNNYTYSLVTIPKPAKEAQGWIETAGATLIQ